MFVMKSTPVPGDIDLQDFLYKCVITKLKIGVATLPSF